jgi:ribonuclease G
MPQLSRCIEHYTGERPLFDLHGVEDEIQKALARRVDLKSGGYLIIDQTEAMTTIDVNTGGFVGCATSTTPSSRPTSRRRRPSRASCG